MAKKDKKKVDFYVWLRSGLRKLSRRWPPVYEALADTKVAYVGDNKRRKFSYVCAHCGQLFDAKSVVVDHKQNVGELTCKEDIVGFITRLFCDKKGLQVLCKEDHDIKTYTERYGCTWEEAVIAKKVIAYLKKPTKEIVAELKALQYNDDSISNADKRRKVVEELFNKGVLK